MNVLPLMFVILFEVAIMFSFITRLYKNFNKSKIPIKKKLFILFMLFLNSLTYELLIVLKHHYASIIYIISLLIIHKLILRENTKCTTLSTTITCVLLSLSNNFSSSIFLLFNETNKSKLLFMILPFIFLFVLSVPLLIYVKNNNNKLNLIVDQLGINPIYTLFCYILIFSLPVTFSTLNNVITSRYYTLYVYISILFSICVFVNYYIYSQYNRIQSEIYQKNLIKTIDELRIIKHDHDNNLQVIKGYLATEKYVDLNEYINYLYSETKSIKYDHVLSPEVVNQPAIYGILSSKYSQAINKEINIKINIATDISSISCDFAKLSRILGILIDNAIEASLKTTPKKVYISFTNDEKNNATLIQIKNSVNNNNINIEDIFKKGVSSKKIKSGIGLWEVKRIIDSNNNSKILTSVKDYIFSQTLIINNVKPNECKNIKIKKYNKQKNKIEFKSIEYESNTDGNYLKCIN